MLARERGKFRRHGSGDHADHLLLNS
jgi:hypothetical protein